MNKHIFSLILGTAIMSTSSAFAMDKYDGGYGSKAPTAKPFYTGGEETTQAKPMRLAASDSKTMQLLNSFELDGKTPATAFATIEGKKYRVDNEGWGIKAERELKKATPLKNKDDKHPSIYYMKEKVERSTEGSQNIIRMSWAADRYTVHNPWNVTQPDEPEITEVDLFQIATTLYEVLPESTTPSTAGHTIPYGGGYNPPYGGGY